MKWTSLTIFEVSVAAEQWSTVLQEFQDSGMRPFQSDDFMKSGDNIWRLRGEVDKPMWREELGPNWQKSKDGLWRQHSQIKMHPRWSEDVDKGKFPKNLRTLRKEAPAPVWIFFSFALGCIVFMPLVLLCAAIMESSDKTFALGASVAFGGAMVSLLVLWKLGFFDFIWRIHVGIWGTWWIAGICLLPITFLLLMMLVDFTFFDSLHTYRYLHKVRGLLRQGFDAKQDESSPLSRGKADILTPDGGFPKDTGLHTPGLPELNEDSGSLKSGSLAPPSDIPALQPGHL